MTTAFETYTDSLRPFLINESNVRGQIVRLSEVVDTILTQHDYAEPVSSLLAELIVIASMLSVNLKGRGKLTVQLKGEGPLRFVVVSVEAKNHAIRGYAQLAEELAEDFFEKKADISFKELVGKGFVSITLDKGKEPYQGVVELKGESLQEVMQDYFTTSVQNEAFITTAVGKHKEPGKKGRWCAGGIMLQHVPHEGGTRQQGSNQMHFEEGDAPEEQWNRAQMLTQTIKDAELLDEHLPMRELLLRLFNEDGVWVYDPVTITHGCSCSRERMQEMLGMFPLEELRSMLKDGKMTINCQFCNREESFSEIEVEAIGKKS
jgi:molecular chaperone Hsp33